MRSSRSPFLLVAIIALGLACKPDTTGPARQAEEFQVSFTHVIAPDSIGPHQVLVMKLSGDLGCEGSYRFDRL